MIKIEEISNSIIEILRSKGIKVALKTESKFNLKDTPEYVLIVPTQLNITDTIRFDGGLTFNATLIMQYEVVCDKDHVNITDLDCRVASVLSEKYDVKIQNIYSIICSQYNKYIVSIEVQNIGFTQSNA